MSQHNYTNPAFCQNSEFYPTPSATRNSETQSSTTVEAIYNRSLNLNFNATAAANAYKNPRDGPLRIQRSMSTRSFVSQTMAATRKTPAKTAAVHMNRQQLQQQQQYQQNRSAYNDATLPAGRLTSKQQEAFEMRSGSGRYALVPVEELSGVTNNNRYAIVPGPALANTKRYTKSQDNLDRYNSRSRLQSDEEPHSFNEDLVAEQYTSLPPSFDATTTPKQQQQQYQSKTPVNTTPKIKHAFSSDFGSKSFLIVDKNSNQRYQMVPTAEDEELVDDNQEIIQMHNGRAHRYAVIPTDDADDDEQGADEEETCLSNTDLNRSENFLAAATYYETTPSRTPLPRTSTPQKGVSLANLASYPNTPLKNPIATKMLHELLSTPRKMPVPRSGTTTPCNNSITQTSYHQHGQQQPQQQLYYTPRLRKHELSPQRLHYETVKSIQPIADRTTAVITPRVAGAKVHPQLDLNDSLDEKTAASNNNGYPQKIANATVTLAIVSLMLVLGSTMNSGLTIYMIGHFGKSFYLQFSLVASFCGVGLGFLGFRSRHCEWLPNRSYTSGYILVTMFCLLKCCGLLVILVLHPYPGLPLHDVTTGVILGLSTFTMFFIGLGVIGSLWCYRPPPDNRVNVV